MRWGTETRVLFDEPVVGPPLDPATAALLARMRSDEPVAIIR